jgi:hypothetical protein
MSMKTYIGNRTRYFLASKAVPQPTASPRAPSLWYFHNLPYRYFLFTFIWMLVVIELVNDKCFGLADAKCRLLGCNITTETERRETRWSLFAHFMGFNFVSNRVMLSIRRAQVKVGLINLCKGFFKFKCRYLLFHCSQTGCLQSPVWLFDDSPSQGSSLQQLILEW